MTTGTGAAAATDAVTAATAAGDAGGGGWKLILFGPPGAGKGTQAGLLKERLGVAHISSGDLFRRHLSTGTELGELARDYMNRGELVPDEVTIGMVLERIGEVADGAGFMLDGFPRNEEQAQALAAALAERGWRIDRALHIRVADEELIRRLSNRYICRRCQRPYAGDAASGAAPANCADCPDGGEMYQREDDTAAAVGNRLSVYHRETAPLLEFYRRQGALADVPGEGAVAAVNAAMLAALGIGSRGQGRGCGNSNGNGG